MSAKVFDLIQRVERYPWLFSKHSGNYKANTMQNNTWTSIAKEISLDPEYSGRVCKKKWTNLKDYYPREHAKVKKTRQSGCGAYGVITSISRQYAIPMTGVLVGDSQLKFLNLDWLRFAANVQTCTFNVRCATALLVEELLGTTTSTVFLFKVVPWCGVDAAEEARRVQSNPRLARLVFFLVKKQPRRNHFAKDGCHISHLVGVRALTRLIKVQVVPQLLHELKLEDYARQVQFCQDNPNHLQFLLFTDESVFHLDGRINKNRRLWSGTDPHWSTEHAVQSPKVVVWCSI
ncbi:hypothetical protein HPB47_000202 [Ixodes persulcatus]|uniref:Uncharacterized protein n=1 Tax=Ixodes persulcatus TaxID=34615 RepID=A0AC60PSR2_IXOPE|nr:hypothetical protein HPB47_000202 [Ixodes persulcatus]